MFGQDADAGVTGRLIFHTSTDERCLGPEKRHSLTLHVGTHEGTVRIIIFQERNHRCTNGYNFLRRYVHEIDPFSTEFTGIFTMTAGNTFVYEMTVFRQRFISLCNDILFFFISCNIVYIVGNDMGFFIYTAVWCFDETKFIDLAKAGQ